MVANSSVKSSVMYIGYLMLKEIKEKNSDKVSIYDISRVLKKKGIGSSRQMVLGLSFLYSIGILEFEEANVWIKK